MLESCWVYANCEEVTLKYFMTITLYFIPIFLNKCVPEIFESHHMYLTLKRNLEMLYFKCIIITLIEIQIC